MQRRFYFFLLSSFAYLNQVIAGSAVWHCEQSKDEKEWICEGAKSAANATPFPEPRQPTTPEPTPPQAIEKNRPDIKSAEQTPITPVAQEKTSTSKSPELTPELPKKASESANTQLPMPPPSFGDNSTQQSFSPKSDEWQCRADSKTQEWQCEQIASMPNPENNENGDTLLSPVKQTSTVNHPIGLLSPAFDSIQEKTFSTLKSQLAINPWQYCENPNALKSIPRAQKKIRNRAPIEVKSNYSEIFENEISSYLGHVEIKRADQRLFSDSANYDNVAEMLDLQGDVYYSDDELAVHSNSASFDLASDQAKLRDVLFIAPTAPLRGYASAIYRDDKNTSRYHNVAFTSCPPNHQEWVVHASELKMNKEEGTGTARNAWLEFQGTPVFYSPYLAFPTDSRRVSGFLAPSFGNTQNSGFNISIPYYWNIAPNFDATLKPRYLTKRGTLLTGEFQYLTENSQGISNIEVLPEDYVRQEGTRYFATIKNVSRFSDKIYANVDLNYVSDKDYFADLGSALSIPNFSFLKSAMDIGYYGDVVTATGRVENYQSVDKALNKERQPFRKLPQINLNFKKEIDILAVPIRAAMDNEFVYFQHDKLKNGQRSHLNPSISLPLQTQSAYLTPKIGLQYTHYFLSDPITPQYSSSISRTLPVLSTDAGMTFERHTQLSGNTYLQTLEPRLFYLYIPRENQNDIPLFDTSVYDIWFNSLFRENRFSGIDRLQDANQLTAALTSRFIDEKTGKERLKLSLGEIFYFDDRNITLPIYDKTGNLVVDTAGNAKYYAPETNRFSNIIGEISARINPHIAVDSGVQWDPESSEISRGKIMLHLTRQPNEILNLGYRYRRNNFYHHLANDLTVPETADGIEQTDASFHLPLYEGWSAVGRWQYSWLYHSTQESFLGVEKENCCWRFRLIGRRYVNNMSPFANDADYQGTSQTGIFFQVELKGLTGIGEKLDSFFEQNIYGYQAPK